MREFGKVKSSLWMSDKFQKLDDDFARLLYIYLLTNQHGNALGCYRIHIGYIMADMDRSEAEILAGLNRLDTVSLTVYDTVSKTVYIRDFLLHSPPSNGNHAKKVFSDTVSIQNEEMRLLVLQDLSRACEKTTWTLDPKLKEQLDTLLIRYGKGIHTQTQTQTQTQTEGKGHPDQSDQKKQPDPKSKKQEELQISNPEIQMAFDQYNHTARKAGWIVAAKLNDTRKKNLKQRLIDAGGFNGWKDALEKATSYKFFKGENDRGWKANIDFFLQQSSFIKITEGAYDETTRNNSQRNSKSDQAKQAVARGLGLFEGDFFDQDTGEIIEHNPNEGRSEG